MSSLSTALGELPTPRPVRIAKFGWRIQGLCEVAFGAAQPMERPARRAPTREPVRLHEVVGCLAAAAELQEWMLDLVAGCSEGLRSIAFDLSTKTTPWIRRGLSLLIDLDAVQRTEQEINDRDEEEAVDSLRAEHLRPLPPPDADYRRWVREFRQLGQRWARLELLADRLSPAAALMARERETVRLLADFYEGLRHSLSELREIERDLREDATTPPRPFGKYNHITGAGLNIDELTRLPETACKALSRIPRGRRPDASFVRNLDRVLDATAKLNDHGASTVEPALQTSNIRRNKLAGHGIGSSPPFPLLLRERLLHHAYPWHVDLERLGRRSRRGLLRRDFFPRLINSGPLRMAPPLQSSSFFPHTGQSNVSLSFWPIRITTVKTDKLPQCSHVFSIMRRSWQETVTGPCGRRHADRASRAYHPAMIRFDGTVYFRSSARQARCIVGCMSC